MKPPCFLALAWLLFLPGFAHSQDEDLGYDWSQFPPDEEGVETQNAETPEVPSYADADFLVGNANLAAPLRSFRGIFLGMGLEALKDAIRKDGIFNFREDRDVSFLPSDQEQTLVETQGFSFIRRAFFQLRYGEVFIMSFALDTSLVDHYSVFTAFVKRYGEPASLNPREAVWETDTARVSIERPLTVKYIDKQSFDMFVRSPKEILTGPSANGARELLDRNEFLEGF
ncbi:MAG: hypothetical protein LBU16_07485 [Treponema sp.]|jgi:hypothetical protein|nr:hypothetical protein [Treponema sp.]